MHGALRWFEWAWQNPTDLYIIPTAIPATVQKCTHVLECGMSRSLRERYHARDTHACTLTLVTYYDCFIHKNFAYPSTQCRACKSPSMAGSNAGREVRNMMRDIHQNSLTQSVRRRTSATKHRNLPWCIHQPPIGARLAPSMKSISLQ